MVVLAIYLVSEAGWSNINFSLHSGEDLRFFLFTAHTTAACRIPGSYGLFFCNFLGTKWPGSVTPRY